MRNPSSSSEKKWDPSPSTTTEFIRQNSIKSANLYIFTRIFERYRVETGRTSKKKKKRNCWTRDPSKYTNFVASTDDKRRTRRPGALENFRANENHGEGRNVHAIARTWADTSVWENEIQTRRGGKREKKVVRNKNFAISIEGNEDWYELENVARRALNRHRINVN